MSLFGTLLRPKHLPSATKVTGWPRSSRKESLHTGPAAETSYRTRNHANNIPSGVRCRARVETLSVENIFIRALVQASSCSNCAASSTSRAQTNVFNTSASHNHRRHHAASISRKQTFSTRAHHEQATPEPEATDTEEVAERSRLGAAIPREAYQDLADTYGSRSKFWQKLTMPAQQPVLSKPTPNHLPLAPRLVLTAEQESKPPYSSRYILPPEDPEHAAQLERLKRLLKNGGNLGMNRKKCWLIYQSLRTPRPRYLTDGDMRRMLRNLTWVEFKTLQHSKRYFSVLDECILEGVQLTAGEWNTAISFAGRWVKKTSVDEVKAAVEAWMRMENLGVTADHVTFNVLFDVAIRAGRFALADSIYEELKARELPLNRYFRTSMIYYAGLRRDGDAVRQAFRQFVNSGEIVDTAVMNCVIFSLLRAREPASAEAVFQKMKELHTAKFGNQSPMDWKGRKLQGKRLHLTARELRNEEEAHRSSFFGSLYSSAQKREDAQRAAPIHPDKRTCELILQHYTLVSGDFAGVTRVLQELKDGGWNLHGSVYYQLFTGFHRHGGHPGTLWKRASLEEFWCDFLSVKGPPPAISTDEISSTKVEPVVRGIDIRSANTLVPEIDSDLDIEPSNEARAPYFTPQLSIAVLRAFYTCAGAARASEAWKQVQDKWPEMTAEQGATVQDVVDKFKLEDTMYIE